MSEKSKSQLAQEKLESVRIVKKLSGDGRWTLVQEVLQEIAAAHTIKDPSQKLPPANKLKEELLEEINRRYKDSEYLDILVSSIPSDVSIRAWIKKDGWDDAVWSKIRTEGLFTKEKRAEVIESLRIRALGRDTTAAKLWLTMSGDYSDKLDVAGDKTLDIFRQYNEALHKKKD
jgi:hypothetical protein